MIKSFEIENFRLFDNLKINRLGRVNLIAGKNNAGKSAFLEAILLHNSVFSLRTIIDLLKNRQEDWDSKLLMDETPLSDPMRHFFNNHVIPEIGGMLKLHSNDSKISLESSAYVVQETENDDGSLIRKKSFVDADHEVGSDARRCLLVKRKSLPTLIIDLDGKIPSRMQLRRISSEEGTTSRFVSPQGIDDEQAAYMWDVVALSDMEEDVILGLKLIEPSLEKLAFIKSDEHRSGRIPIAKLNGFDVPVPLKSLGDGMTRVLHIILSLVSCKSGEILVIDEFENGLHWSIQPKVWEMIFMLAKKLNVQVFASTHSRDCVAGFHEAWENNEKDGAFLRLMRGDGQPPVQEYDLELLADSLDTNTEVR